MRFPSMLVERVAAHSTHPRSVPTRREHLCAGQSSNDSMRMAVMRVGVMIVGMSDRFVPMPVAVPHSRSDGRFMLGCMVHVVFVLVLVLHRLVGMPVDVMLGKM